MAANWKLRSALSLAFLAIVGMVSFLAEAAAQDAKAAWITAGYVRPDAKAMEGDALGGTIYYAVYQLPAKITNPNDPYNTGLDLAKDFVPGTGSNDAKSPASLVPTGKMPKYLYLYEIVNDRGLEPKGGIRPAGLGTEVKSRDIGSMVLKLAVAPSAIESWGYFKNSGFSIDAMDRGLAGEERPGSLPARTNIAVSANPSVLVALKDANGKSHGRGAMPVEFDAKSGFKVSAASKNLKDSYFVQQLNKPGIKPVAWEQEAIKAAQVGGEIPEAVEILSSKFDEKNLAKSVLRAKFTANPLKLGKHSVLIGFTTNAAPGQDLVRLQDTDSAKKVSASAIRTVSNDDIDFGAGGKIALPKEEPAKTPDVTTASGKAHNLIVDGLVTPGDIPSDRLVDKGTFKTFGGTVYYAVFKRTSAAGGDTWGVGRSDFDNLFNPGESYRGTFSPRLDTDAEYLYLYQVVNDRGFHDLKLPQNKMDVIRPVAGDLTEERPAITREVASFSLFLRTDPRLITSWGFFDDAGFNVKVADEHGLKQVANDPNAPKPAPLPMAISSNLSILDTIYGEKDKIYKPWAPPVKIEGKTSLSIGKDTTNITANKVRLVGNNRSGNFIRQVANKALENVAETGAVKPDYAQIIYFDGANPINGATIDGITLGPAEVARAIFKVEWLTKNVTEGRHSVCFGFTSNVEPVRAPVRLKDLYATVNESTEVQERTFLSPAEIKSLALNAIRARGIAPGTAPGIAPGIAPVVNPGVAPGAAPGAGIALASLNADAIDSALAVANGVGQGILPASLASLARGSIGTGIAISPSVATPAAGVAGEAASGGAGVMGFPPVAANTGTTAMGGGGFGGLGGMVGQLGTARMPFMGGGGSGGSGGGSNQGSAGSDTTGQSTGAGQGSGQGDGSGQGNAQVVVNNNFTISQFQQQAQSQWQLQKQKQNQSQKNGGGGDCCGHRGNVVPAPASLLLGLLGVPGLYFAYRRRRQSATEQSTEEPTEQTPETPAE